MTNGLIGTKYPKIDKSTIQSLADSFIKYNNLTDL